MDWLVVVVNLIVLVMIMAGIGAAVALYLIIKVAWKILHE